MNSPTRQSGIPTVTEYLTTWLGRLKVDPNTISTYEPRLGDIVLDKLRPHHIEYLIEQIEARNAEILAAKTGHDPDLHVTVRRAAGIVAGTERRRRPT